MNEPINFLASNTSFPPDFVPLEGSARDCEACASGERLGFQFDFAYQPIIDVNARAVFAHEALVRGPHGEPAPSVLAQVDQHNRYRFDQACRVKAIRSAKAAGIERLVSINFMPNAIFRPETCLRPTLEAARQHGFPLDHIILEVTEGERVQDGPWFAEVLRECKRFGIQTAIDDFGAGYAGLHLLADFQPDIVKIDMDLVRGIDGNAARQSIVRHLVRLFEEMKLVVVAEGIETVAERDFLRGEGITLMQGFLFARPAFQSTAHIAEDAFHGMLAR